MTEAFKQGYMDKMAELRKSAKNGIPRAPYWHELLPWTTQAQEAEINALENNPFVPSVQPLPVEGMPPVYKFPKGMEPWMHGDSLNSTNRVILNDLYLPEDWEGRTAKLGPVELPGGFASVTSSVPTAVSATINPGIWGSVKKPTDTTDDAALWSFTRGNVGTLTSLGEAVLQAANDAADAQTLHRVEQEERAVNK